MYVPNNAVLGNPGFFGFIGKAVKAVAGVVSSVVGGVSKGGTVQVAPPQVILQTPAPQVQLGKGEMPPWVLPVAVGGGALLLVMLMRKR